MALILVILTSASVAAGPARESVILVGPVTVPAGTTVATTTPLAVYYGDTTHAGFMLTASKILVHSFEARAVGVPSLVVKEVSFDERTWVLTNVTIQLVPGGDNAGSLGIYPSEATNFKLTTTFPTDIAARQNSQIPANRQGRGAALA